MLTMLGNIVMLEPNIDPYPVEKHIAKSTIPFDELYRVHVVKNRENT